MTTEEQNKKEPKSLSRNCYYALLLYMHLTTPSPAASESRLAFCRPTGLAGRHDASYTGCIRIVPKDFLRQVNLRLAVLVRTLVYTHWSSKGWLREGLLVVGVTCKLLDA
jgi:hypothetical protein